jgi:hypothetical protein
MDGRALLLNASFQPLQVISWQKDVQMFFSGKVEIVESSDNFIRSVSVTIKMPVVIRLLNFVSLSHRKNVVRLNRNNVFQRDHHTCQYCGKSLPFSQLTLDHVVPVVKGGKKTWENITTACRSCNVKKGGRTPEEAQMKLRSRPKQPIWIPIMGMNIDLSNCPEYISILIKSYAEHPPNS